MPICTNTSFYEWRTDSGQIIAKWCQECGHWGYQHENSNDDFHDWGYVLSSSSKAWLDDLWVIHPPGELTHCFVIGRLF